MTDFDKELYLSLCDKYGVKFQEQKENKNEKLVQYIRADYINGIKLDMYYYGDATLEENQSMQEPLEKLYKYENQPDMRDKVKEYISELDTEINRCKNLIEERLQSKKTDEEKEIYTFSTEYITLTTRIITLTEVRDDLKSRLEELV